MMKRISAWFMCLVMLFGINQVVWAAENVQSEINQAMEEINQKIGNEEISGYLKGSLVLAENASVEIANAPIIENDVTNSEDFFYLSPDMMYLGYKQYTSYDLSFILENTGGGSTFYLEITDEEGSVYLCSEKGTIYDLSEGSIGTDVLGIYEVTYTWTVDAMPVGVYYIDTYVDNQLTSSSEVYVVDKDVAMTGIELDYEKIVMDTNSVEFIAAYFLPENTTERADVVWTSSDSTVVEIEEYAAYNTGVDLVSRNYGCATITATTGRFSASCVVKVVDVADVQNKIGEFVTRLYDVCLNRTPDEAGKADWVERLYTGEVSGSEAAYGFIFSPEFIKKNLCNEDFVEQLYQAFMGRASDAAGKEDWVSKLEVGMTREEVFNGFALSKEFTKICTNYGIEIGTGAEMPAEGTVPNGPCKICGKETIIKQDIVEAFVQRLYRICLNRPADESGLADWTAKLKSQKTTGRDVAYGFIFSHEFKAKNTTNDEYVEYLYKAFMGRGSDPLGKADWLGRMSKGWTRLQVFDGFVESQEFTDICDKYGIVRD